MAKKTRTDVTTKIAEINAKTYADTVAGKIESIEDHSELVSIEVSYLGLGDDLKLAPAAKQVAGIINKGTIDEKVKEGESYTIVAGYYEGGTVKGIAGGGNYNLETPAAVTPTTAEQVITPSAGYYGLAQVTVEAIPTNYKDVTGTNDTTAADILSGKKAVTTAGTIEGTMANNGAVSKTLTTTSDSYTVPVGYHNGSGKVTVSSTTKTITPTEDEQVYSDPGNKFLTSVTVEAIDKTTYLTNWTSDATAEDVHILTGKTAYVNGAKVSGAMADKTAWDAADHTLTTASTSVSIPAGYHDGTGTVKIVTESKTAAALTPGVAQQTITPTTGKVLSSVIVPALDAKYQDVSGTTATAAHVCSGYKFTNASGTVVTGTLADGGDLEITNFYDTLMASGSSGVTVLSGTEAHYTKVDATIDGSLYDRLAAI